MPTHATEPFAQVRAYIDNRSGPGATFKDVVALAEITADSMQAFFASVDRSVYGELREIADYIVTMRQEIGLLQASDLKDNRLPKAGEHLGAIVEATEEATNAIMESAEAILEADAADPVAYKALVDEKVMAIFEACSFQDLTGQRIARIVETLANIEARVARFAAAVDVGGADAPLAETEREARERALLLNGPQARGVAIDQNDIDALMADIGAGAPPHA
jgi:chemotaxis protein CheZ